MATGIRDSMNNTLEGISPIPFEPPVRDIISKATTGLTINLIKEIQATSLT